MKNPLPLLALIPVLLAGQSTSVSAQSILIDFGSGDAAINAFLTVSDASNGPDSNGNFWNNYSTNGATLNNLVFTDNSTSGISLAGVGTQVASQNLGVTNGTVILTNNNLNVFTAYTDGIFRTSGNATLTLSGLDSSNTYSFELFGSRNAAESRITRFTAISGNGTEFHTLQTSGIGIGSGALAYNTSNTVSFLNLAPDGSNQISILLEVESGGFGYLNAMQITVIPEPSTVALLILGVGLIGFFALRRKGALTL